MSVRQQEALEQASLSSAFPLLSLSQGVGPQAGLARGLLDSSAAQRALEVTHAPSSLLWCRTV